jgi:hypothetical protein
LNFVNKKRGQHEKENRRKKERKGRKRKVEKKNIFLYTFDRKCKAKTNKRKTKSFYPGFVKKRS